MCFCTDVLDFITLMLTKFFSTSMIPSDSQLNDTVNISALEMFWVWTLNYESRKWVHSLWSKYTLIFCWRIRCQLFHKIFEMFLENQLFWDGKWVWKPPQISKSSKLLDRERLKLENELILQINLGLFTFKNIGSNIQTQKRQYQSVA